MRRAVVALGLLGCHDVFSIDELQPPPSDMVCGAEFCIDRTETTRGAYAEFLATSPVAVGAGCEGNDLVPAGTWPPAPGEEHYPVVNVDWCDAFSFCAEAGKRLCGRIGGGPVARSDVQDVTQSQWYFACTGGVQDRTYPYGDAYEAGRCNVEGARVEGTAQYPDCSGGLDGLLDMVGNVWEWEDACDGTGPDANCYIRGGDFNESSNGATCRTAVTHSRQQNTFARFGFRCCIDR